MKKSIITLVLAMAVGLCFCACKNNTPPVQDGNDPAGPNKSVTVTFRQDGREDIIKTVESGASLTDIPTPQQDRLGYTFVWNVTDFSSVTENIIVIAVAQANVYTITYDAGEGTVETETQEVTYDSYPTFSVPTRSGYTFIGWMLDGKAVLGKWTIAQDVTLVASWIKKDTNLYTVIFRQNGCEDKIFENIEEGAAFTDIPAPTAKTGYNVAWKAEDLEKLDSVNETVVVEAVETAKTYTVTLNANGGAVSQATISVTYGQSYNLPVPTNGESRFGGWAYDGNSVPLTGAWNIDGTNIELTAQWNEGSWTENH